MSQTSTGEFFRKNGFRAFHAFLVNFCPVVGELYLLTTKFVYLFAKRYPVIGMRRLFRYRHDFKLHKLLMLHSAGGPFPNRQVRFDYFLFYSMLIPIGNQVIAVEGN